MSVRKTTSEAKDRHSTSGPMPASFPIVGIGASAGGLEACTALLKSLDPNLGMAFVVVPHLDPSRESALREILARATQMPVTEAQSGTTVEANHVYVIPRNCDMTISQGVLHLNHIEKPRTALTTIDIFLRSLAADRGSNAIGVILSGTASDGTLGLAAIKGEGGITFAQDSSAKYDGMPASAIAAGCVDLILPPKGIAEELARIRQHPYVAGTSAAEEPVSQTRDEQMAQIFVLLRRTTRVDFSEYKPPTIGRRIQRRMALHKFEKLGDYVTLLRQDGRELNALYQDLLINVTSFFRDEGAFDALKHAVYPVFLQRREHNTTPIRIWVPGCSTGEEAYSHAMSLVEFLGEERTEVPIQIFGTDLSETAIQRARAGVFKESIEPDLSPIRLRRFFQRIDSGYQISKTIRDLCIFSTQNVFSDPPFSRIDLLSCRNVMVYVGHSLQQRVIPIFHYALNPDGFLMLGNTEGLMGAGDELFELAAKKYKIYRTKAVASPLTSGLAVNARQERSPRQEPPAASDQPQEFGRMPADLQREADRLLLGRYAPPCVVVSADLEILHAKGHTSKFLELPSGRASLNLLKMARAGLLFELQSATDEANKTGEEAVRLNVPVEADGTTRPISVRVTPFGTAAHDKRNFLVTFEPAGVEPSRSTETAPALTDDERATKDNQEARLTQELAATKEYLQSIIETLEGTNEELQSANEEIQSGNEELQSTNEELQTSKEELESANEELHTVNEEMQHRNELLTQLNNDLTNLLNSINLAVVMVGPDLGVRRFTPRASKVLGLIGNDVGRPITRLKLNIDSSELEQKMLDVMEHVKPEKYRVKDLEGHWFELRLAPYRTGDNRIDGVVLTAVNSDLLHDDMDQETDAVSPPRERAARPAAQPKKKRRK